MGALLVGISAILPWVASPFATENALEVPLEFLIDFRASDSSPFVGWLVLGIGLLAFGMSFLLRATPILRSLGVLALLTAILFAAQWWRFTNDTGSSSLFGSLGVGLYALAIGGAILAFTSSEKAS